MLNTHSNTSESCWSPQIRISAMQRSDSTSRPRLLSDTVVFFSRMLYRYLRCSSDKRFLGRPPQGPPNQLRLRNMLATRMESTGHDPPDCSHIRVRRSAGALFSWIFACTTAHGHATGLAHNKGAPNACDCTNLIL